MEPKLQSAAQSFRVVTLLGPRQSGKTTLVRAVFPEKPYVNLENLDVRARAAEDPRAFLANFRQGAILDEIQNLPELLSYIQALVDEHPQKGLFILTGSHQLALHQAISQSLAGRTAVLDLLPMSLKEIAQADRELSVDEAILQGGYPQVLLEPETERLLIFRSYLRTYVERDIRQLLQIKDLVLFQKFLTLVAGRIGQICNFQGLSNEVGVSAQTIQNWISILEASFIVIRLAPYYENFGKRVLKTPKLYFADVGFAAFLLGIETTQQLSRDPLRGQLFENLLFLELLKERLNRGLDPHLYFYRDQKGHEVDFLFQTGRELVPIEGKSGQTFHPEFLNGLKRFQELTDGRSPHGFLVYAGEHSQRIGNVELLNISDAWRCLHSFGGPPTEEDISQNGPSGHPSP